jgi:cytochrome P450
MSDMLVLQLAFNVVAQYLLGSRLKAGPVNDSLRADFYTLTEGMFALPIDLPGTNFRKGLEARKRIVETLERDVVSQPRPEGDEDQYADYMEYMRKENLPGTTEELLVEKTRCHVLGMLFAGHETAASAMLFAVKYITDNPRVLSELRAEHDNIRTSKFEGGGLTWDDYKNMPFTQSVVTETLRLANPVTLLWREATEDVQLNGFVIPKGWKTVSAIREAHYDPTFFEHPSEFNPWRHQHEVMNPAKKLPFLAFGGGPRYCPGMELARAEICIFIHHLVTKFDLKPCGPETMTFFPVPKFSNGLQVRVSERDPATKITHKILA